MASSDPNKHQINGDFPSLVRNVPSGALRRPGATSMNAVDEITTRTSALSVNTLSLNGPSQGKKPFSDCLSF